MGCGANAVARSEPHRSFLEELLVAAASPVEAGTTSHSERSALHTAQPNRSGSALGTQGHATDPTNRTTEALASTSGECQNSMDFDEAMAACLELCDWMNGDGSRYRAAARSNNWVELGADCCWQCTCDFFVVSSSDGVDPNNVPDSASIIDDVVVWGRTTAGPYQISGGCGADNSGDPSIPCTAEEIFMASPGDPCYRGDPLIDDGGAEDWDAENASSPNPG